MPDPGLFLLFVRPLNRAGIRYVVTGSVAAIFYGEPRLEFGGQTVVLAQWPNREERPNRYRVAMEKIRETTGVLRLAASDA